MSKSLVWHWKLVKLLSSRCLFLTYHSFPNLDLMQFCYSLTQPCHLLPSWNYKIKLSISCLFTEVWKPVKSTAFLNSPSSYVLPYIQTTASEPLTAHRDQVSECQYCNKHNFQWNMPRLHHGTSLQGLFWIHNRHTFHFVSCQPLHAIENWLRSQLRFKALTSYQLQCFCFSVH